MTLQWFVVKHLPDLVRQEPHNIGVILVSDEGDVRASRFVGEDENGNIDGRRLGSIGNHLVYKAWVKQWNRLRDDGAEALHEVVNAGRATGGSFFVEVGGSWVLGDDGLQAEDVLADLYTRLVREDTAGPVADDVRVLSNRLLRSVGVMRKVQQKFSLTVEYQGAPDELWFDYRYDNGQPHLMQRVGLASADKSTWDRLHSVELNFQRLSDSGALPDFNPVALVKMDQADSRLVRAVDSRLAQVAQVVNVADQPAAERQLREVLHLD